MPEEGDFRLDLPAGNASPSAQAPLFAAFDREVPRPSPWHAVVGRDGTLFVQGPELTPATVVDAWFIPDTPGTIRDSAAQPLTVWHGGFTLALRPGKAFRPEGELSGVLSIRDRSGLETDVVLRATAGTVPPQPPTMGLRRLLGLAFLGGLILNLMPCVFPVLALKVVGLAGAREGKGALAGGRLYGRRAGGIRWSGRGAAGGARRGYRGRLGIPVPVPGVRRRHGLAAVRCRAQPFRGL